MMRSANLLCFGSIALMVAIGSNSATAQTVFFEDFGSAQERVASPYVPSAGADSGLGSNAFYQFSAANGIPDGRYTVLPPSLLDTTGADSYWQRIAEDHTPGPENGALMVLNAGDKFNQFYRRQFEVESGKSYRISVWRYVVNGNQNISHSAPVYWDLEVQEVNSEQLLGNSGDIGNTLFREWEESTWEFTVPLTCDAPTGSSQQVSMSLRNRSPVTNGNDIYIDDISVTEIPNASSEIECPTENVYIVEATNDSAETEPDTSVDIPVLENDSAKAGSGLPGNALLPSTLVVTSPPANGTVEVNPDGTVTYTPNTGFSGTDEFTYQVCNDAPTPACDTAIVTVKVGSSTPVTPAAPVSVPTMGVWSLAFMSLFLCFLGVIRRRNS